jgi:hypothetical protein
MPVKTPVVADYDLTVQDQRCHLGEIGPEQDLWENHGILMRARATDGNDVMLWTSPYIVHRGPHSYYANEMNILQTVLVVTDYTAEERRRMHDNEFVASGWSPSEYLPPGSIQVDPSSERVLWKVKGREYEDAPPHWAIRGEHAGVDLQLSLDAYIPSFPVFPHARFAEDGITWYEAYLRAGGRIAHAGRELQVEGFACHERVIVTRDHEPHLMLGRGLYWHHLFDERVQAWIMTAPSAQYALAYVVVDGQTFCVRSCEDVQIDDLETWTDPRSGFTVPYRWKVRVKTPAGTLRIEAGAYARAYYPWSPFADTWNILYWMPAEASGSFDAVAGRSIEIRDAMYMGHSNRVFFERKLHAGQQGRAAVATQQGKGR